MVEERERERLSCRQAVWVTAVASRVYRIKSDHLRFGREGGTQLTDAPTHTHTHTLKQPWTTLSTEVNYLSLKPTELMNTGQGAVLLCLVKHKKVQKSYLVSPTGITVFSPHLILQQWPSVRSPNS